MKNKYTRWYFSIIKRAKSQARQKSLDVYFESHHIIPESMGGTEKVLLTAKEHFICHALLIKMTVGSDKAKMLFAFQAMRMNNENQQRYTSRLYEIYKPKIKELVRKNLNTGIPWNKGLTSVMDDRVKANGISKRGKKRNAETRMKMRLAKLGKSSPRKGKKLPKEWIDNMKIARANSPKFQAACRENIRKYNDPRRITR